MRVFVFLQREGCVTNGISYPPSTETYHFTRNYNETEARFLSPLFLWFVSVAFLHSCIVRTAAALRPIRLPQPSFVHLLFSPIFGVFDLCF